MKRVTKASIKRTAEHLATARAVLRHARYFWDWEANGGMGREVRWFSINGGPQLSEAEVNERIALCKEHLRIKLQKFKERKRV